jgi:deazaflavin-dependent oxidoreductase (nitroreductase family)
VFWRLFNNLTRIHVLAYRLTGGLIGRRVPAAPPMLLLEHEGAKSGTKRTTPLAYMEDRGSYVIVASKGGHPKHPAWFHNLKAHPHTVIQVGPNRMPVEAKVATAAQRKRLWPKIVDMYDGFAGYQAKTDRQIPLVILKPQA